MISVVLLHALSTFSLTKMLLQHTQPFFLIGIRMSIAGIILFGYCFFYQKKFKIPQRHIFYFIQIILFALYFPYILRYYGLLYCPESRAFMLYNSGPLITYFCVLFFAIEKFNARKMSLLCISYGAILLISPMVLRQQSLALTSFGLPDFALLCSVISFSYGWLLIRKLITELHYHPFLINSITMTCGGLLALFTSLSIEKTPFVTEFFPFVTLISVIILVSNIVCHNWYALLLKKYSQTFIVLGSLLCPFFTTFYGALFNKAISWHYYCAFLIINISLFLYYREEKKIVHSKQNLSRLHSH